MGGHTRAISLLRQGLWDVFPPAPGPKRAQAAPATASADQTVQPDGPTFERTPDGALHDAQPSTDADGELQSIVSPLVESAGSISQMSQVLWTTSAHLLTSSPD